jgi:hypothetical protein
MATESVFEPGELPPAEQRLLQEVMATVPGRGDSGELTLSLARLRNLRQKYAERAKRCRLEARAGLAVESRATLSTWIERIEAAERHARACLAADQEPGSTEPPAGDDSD